MDVMGHHWLMSLLLVCTQEEEEDKREGGEDGKCFSRDGSLKNEMENSRVGSANTARQRFPDGEKQKFVADEKFIREAKILAKRQRSDQSV